MVLVVGPLPSSSSANPAVNPNVVKNHKPGTAADQRIFLLLKVNRLFFRMQV
jgi:hypothetical protein